MTGIHAGAEDLELPADTPGGERASHPSGGGQPAQNDTLMPTTSLPADTTDAALPLASTAGDPHGTGGGAKGLAGTSATARGTPSNPALIGRDAARPALPVDEIPGSTPAELNAVLKGAPANCPLAGGPEPAAEKPVLSTGAEASPSAADKSPNGSPNEAADSKKVAAEPFPPEDSIGDGDPAATKEGGTHHHTATSPTSGLQAPVSDSQEDETIAADDLPKPYCTEKAAANPPSAANPASDADGHEEDTAAAPGSSDLSPAGDTQINPAQSAQGNVRADSTKHREAAEYTKEQSTAAIAADLSSESVPLESQIDHPAPDVHAGKASVDATLLCNTAAAISNQGTKVPGA